MDIGNSTLVHREFERGKSMADNGGPVSVILNRRSLGFTIVIKTKIIVNFHPRRRRKLHLFVCLLSMWHKMHILTKTAWPHLLMH